jgi:hypothetical protein
MSRKRLLLALGIGLVVLVVAGAVSRLIRRPPYIDQVHCDRIKPGMRLEDVEAIFGTPPGCYADGRFEPGLYSPSAESPIGIWANDEASVVIWFANDGTVQGQPLFRPEDGPTLFERFRRLYP